MNWLRRIGLAWPWLAAVCSGLLYAASFPPWNQNWFCWICLTPLLAAIWFSGKPTRLRWLRDILLGYVAGLAFFWTVFFWLTTVTVPGWFLLAFYMGGYFALWGWLCGLTRRQKESAPAKNEMIEPAPPARWSEILSARSGFQPTARSSWVKSSHNLAIAFFLASAWTIFEWFRGWVISGFGWNGLGVALHANWPIIQIAEFTGVAGLSFVVAFANVIAVTTVRRIILETRVRPMRPHWDLNFTMLGIVALLAFGWHAGNNQRSSHPLRLAAVQTNVGREEKFDPGYADAIFRKLDDFGQRAFHGEFAPQLIIFPESSLPGRYPADEATGRFVSFLAKDLKVDVLAGIINEEKDRIFNAALLASPDARIQLYRKVHLVPFGEYIPGRQTVPLLARIVGDQVPGDFDRGEEYTVFRLTTADAQVAPLICFEDTIGELTRRFVQQGANLLANVTNDGWFKESAGSQQHVANAIFRCVETRCPMIRAANTGVTCAVDQLGRLRPGVIVSVDGAGRTASFVADAHGNQFTDGILLTEVNVPTGSELTFYTRHGELFAKSCGGITLIGLAIALARRKWAGRSTAN